MRIVSLAFLFIVSILSPGIFAAPAPGAGSHELKLPADLAQGSHGTVPVTVYVPESKDGKFAGDILLLPGWNHSRSRWFTETRLKKLADEKKFRIIAPEMGKSVYSSRYFPETRIKWNPLPGLVWIEKILIPYFQEMDMLKEGSPSYLLGFSTGARGVAQIGIGHGNLFAAAAALSGDYNQTLIQNDNLMKAMYGPYNSFANRWSTVDNPALQAKDWKIPLYLAHGKKDTIVPFAQTQDFYEKVHRLHPDLDLIFSAPGDAGHTYPYLDGELTAIINFFLKHPEVD